MPFHHAKSSVQAISNSRQGNAPNQLDVALQAHQKRSLINVFSAFGCALMPANCRHWQLRPLLSSMQISSFYFENESHYPIFSLFANDKELIGNLQIYWTFAQSTKFACPSSTGKPTHWSNPHTGRLVNSSTKKAEKGLHLSAYPPATSRLESPLIRLNGPPVNPPIRL